MKKNNILFTFFIGLLSFSSCTSTVSNKFDSKTNKFEIEKKLTTLLSSLENKNIEALKSTMSPTGKMELIVPNSKITYTVDEFVDFHTEWFKDTTWTMETKILNIEPGEIIGTATTEAIYREPDRDGKPYFNHMIVSYVLEKHKDQKWYVIKDHACTFKKSTDKD